MLVRPIVVTFTAGTVPVPGSRHRRPNSLPADRAIRSSLSR
jgi:hypothetical protein